jgi:hypothetical protein
MRPVLAATVANGLVRQKEDEAAFINYLQSQYPALGNAFLDCMKGDTTAVTAAQNYLATWLEASATESDINSGGAPLLGFEYDFNTPTNQPSYFSVKSNFSINLGARKVLTKGESCGGKSASSLSVACTTATSAMHTQVGTALDVNSRTLSASQTASDTKSKTAAAKVAAASSTQPWTINASVAGDFYNSQPPTSVPSSERLRDFQAALEIDYKVATSKIPGVGSLMGDSTLAGTYYYQDQTSPSILNGPPSSVTIADLPSTASQVYTTRGPINLGQIRYGLGTGSNVSFPICFTYANRSELVTHPFKGLQFGLSYNLSSLFQNSSK